MWSVWHHLQSPIPVWSFDLTLLEICLPFRLIFIAGNLSALPPILHCRKSVRPSAHSSLPEIRPPFRSFFIAGNPSVLPPDLHCRKSVCPSAWSSLPEICLPFRSFFIAGNPSVLPSALHCCCYHNLLFRAISDSWLWPAGTVALIRRSGCSKSPEYSIIRTKAPPVKFQLFPPPIL